jgi:hypothetical protein
MSVRFSWGSKEDRNGRTIDAHATHVGLPETATDADIADLVEVAA